LILNHIPNYCKSIVFSKVDSVDVRSDHILVLLFYVKHILKFKKTTCFQREYIFLMLYVLK